MAQGVLDEQSAEDKALREEKQRENLELLNNQLRMNRNAQMEQMQRMQEPGAGDGSGTDDDQEEGGQDGRGSSNRIKEGYEKYKERQAEKKAAEEAARKRAEQEAAKKGVEEVERQAVRQGVRTAAGAGAEAAGSAAAGAAAGGAAAGAAAAEGGAAAAAAVEATPVGWIATAIVAVVLIIIVLLIAIFSAYFLFCETPGMQWIIGGKKNCPGEIGSNYEPNTPQTANDAWVNISAIQVTGGPIPTEGIAAENQPARVKQTIAEKLARLWELSRAEGINWVVTSAYRVGTGSCHNLGEAVDIGLRPRPTPVPGQENRAGRPLYTDPRISRLMLLANDAGFSFVLDEYNFPTGRATGEHIHLSIGGYKYCVDNDQ